MSEADREPGGMADDLERATRRLHEIAQEIRASEDASPALLAELAEEAARLAAEVATGIGEELRGGGAS